MQRFTRTVHVCIVDTVIFYVNLITAVQHFPLKSLLTPTFIPTPLATVSKANGIRGTRPKLFRHFVC